MMPSWLLPRPSSSSAQIIPSLNWPLIFDTLMVKDLPVVSYNSVSGNATHTVWPAAMLLAPQTIVDGAVPPTSTVVTDNLSASGCLTQVRTLPATTPFNPPLTDSHVSIFSTS